VNPRKPQHTVLPHDKAADFRWIHLPANNMAWIEVLLTKLFIEEGASDVEGFKALEKSFSHQHRGQQSHSHFMRPLCQSTPRAPREKIPEAPEDHVDHAPPTIVINGAADGNSGLRKPMSRSSTGREDSNEMFRSPSRDERDYGRGGAPKDKAKKSTAAHVKGNKSPKIGTSTPKENKSPKIGTSSPSRKEKEPRGHTSYHGDDRRPHSPSSSSSGRKDSTHHPKGNIFIFMPYLHFESSRRRQEMQDAIKRAESLRLPLCPTVGKAKTYDEMLIRAHLATSTASLHVRRTLDQSFYHNIDTESRDQDQVVYRYQLKGTDLDSSDVDPKIVMVDQLWMWVLGPSLIVTSFPQRWQQPKNDPLNVLDNVIEDINSKTREPVKSVYDLAMTITSRCTGVFDRHRMGDEEYQFLDMFESSIGSATDRETVLFKEFNTASAQASAWLQHHRRPDRFSRYLSATKEDTAAANSTSLSTEEITADGPLFVDKLLDIGLETDLLAETKDIRDELNMISKILSEQASVLPDLRDAIASALLSFVPPPSSQSIKRATSAQLKTIELHLHDLERMDRQALRIYRSITDMLDLKQKHANAFEARFARDQAAGTMRQGQTIMVFTIVTIIFLPLSFIAAFFAINVREFPRDDQGMSLPLRWVAKYMFGIGFAVSIPLIAIALSLDDIAGAFKHGRGWLSRRWQQQQQRQRRRGQRRRGFIRRGPRDSSFSSSDGATADEGMGIGGLDVLKLSQAISLARSGAGAGAGGGAGGGAGRKSMDTEWLRERLSMSQRPGTTGAASSTTRHHHPEREREKIPTGFRMRGSMDVERGMVMKEARRG